MLLLTANPAYGLSNTQVICLPGATGYMVRDFVDAFVVKQIKAIVSAEKVCGDLGSFINLVCDWARAELAFPYEPIAEDPTRDGSFRVEICPNVLTFEQQIDQALQG